VCHGGLWGSGDTAPLILNLSDWGRGKWSASHPGHFIFGVESPKPFEWEAGWAPELVLMVWRSEKSFDAVKNHSVIPWLSSD
jgi:hypothetical protein